MILYILLSWISGIVPAYFIFRWTSKAAFGEWKISDRNVFIFGSLTWWVSLPFWLILLLVGRLLDYKDDTPAKW